AINSSTTAASCSTAAMNEPSFELNREERPQTVSRPAAAASVVTPNALGSGRASGPCGRKALVGFGPPRAPRRLRAPRGGGPWLAEDLERQGDGGERDRKSVV